MTSMESRESWEFFPGGGDVQSRRVSHCLDMKGGEEWWEGPTGQMGQQNRGTEV